MSGASDTLDPIAAAEAKNRGVEAPDGGCGRRTQPAAALACALSRRREAARAPRHGPGGPASAGSRAPRPDAVLAAARFAFLRVARSVASFVSRTAVALFTTMHRAATACIAWLRPRAYALGASLAQVARSPLGVDRGAIARPCPHPRAMERCGLGMDMRACGDAGAGIGQGCSTRRVVARSHIARARHRALAWAR